MASFWKNFFGEGAKKAGESAEELIASVAPDMMNAAQIETIREELEEITEKVVAAQNFMNKERAETEAEQIKVNNGITALNILQGDLEKTTDAGEKSEIEEAMVGLLDELDQANIDLAREKEEDIEAEENLAFWKERQKQRANVLKQTKSSSEKVKRALEVQEAKTERANERASYGDSGSASNVATNAMERRLQKLKDEENVANQMSALTTEKSVTKTNSRVAAAMAQANGVTDTSSMSATDRLAAMKAKMGK